MIKIYKASAGAGKTHKLAGEYINLLFKNMNRDDSDIFSYKHILAVTFTNKATEEMKGRILSELYLLANNKKSSYLKELVTYTKCDEMRVRTFAKRVLAAILHDYSMFSISTIDKFFQGIMRSFAKELGKMNSYNLEINDADIRQHAVDELFTLLDKPEYKKVLEWIVNFALDDIENGLGWYLKPKITDMSRYLFTENYRTKLKGNATSALMSEKYIDDVETLKKNVNLSISDYKRGLLHLANETLAAIKAKGKSVTDYKDGSRSPFRQLEKISNGALCAVSDSLINCYNNKDKWVTKANAKKIDDFYSDEINDCLGKVISYCNNNYSLFVSAQFIKSNINSLGIMGAVFGLANDYCKENNLVLLSDSVELLHKIINGSDAPFIYERIGTRLDNFLLDEFQDTSSMQWDNFKPLLQESISKGEDNLIVGDVKQSIFRWRSSDWNILNSALERSFKGDCEVESLNNNWRSAQHIVSFNNVFFEKTALLLEHIYFDEYTETSLITQIYSNFKQNVPESTLRTGFITADMLSLPYDNRDKVSAEEYVMKNIIESLPDIIEQGYSLSDIAVITRKKNDGAKVAEYLEKNGYRVVSNESLYIGSSKAVNKIINILHTVDDPENSTLSIYNILGDNGIDKETIINDKELYSLPLYSACEKIIRTYLKDDEKQELSYIQSFLDNVSDFVSQEGDNLPALLKWWNDVGKTTAISAPPADAINILTIHKAKGLGFKIVFLPFFNFPLVSLNSGKLQNHLWCNIHDMPFDCNFPVPLAFRDGLRESVFRKEYFDESLYSFIDALNLSYVAFTRAIDELHIISVIKENKNGGYKFDNVGTVAYSVMDSMQLEREKFSESGLNFIKFKLGDRKKAETDKNKPIDMIEAVPVDIFKDSVDINRIKISICGNSILDEESLKNKGIALHYIFSLINSYEDVQNAIKQAISDGIISKVLKYDIDIEGLVKSALESVSEYGWFNKNAEIINERDIVSPNGSISRPDRIVTINDSTFVIDYKFGKFDENSAIIEKYKKQVAYYSLLLKRMGYKNVCGYIWYPINRQIIKV